RVEERALELLLDRGRRLSVSLEQLALPRVEEQDADEEVHRCERQPVGDVVERRPVEPASDRADHLRLVRPAAGDSYASATVVTVCSKTLAIASCPPATATSTGQISASRPVGIQPRSGSERISTPSRPPMKARPRGSSSVPLQSSIPSGSSAAAIERRSGPTRPSPPIPSSSAAPNVPSPRH